MKVSTEERAEAIAQLKKWLKPGDTVYTILRHVSRSGMRRVIGVVILKYDRKQRRIVDLHPNYSVSKVLGLRRGDSDGVVIDGCGMDMGFALVYDLGRALWPDGTPKPHGTRNGEPDRDGGYALQHRWL